MKVLSTTYVVYSSEEPYLPIFVDDDIKECARFLGVSVGYLKQCLYYDSLVDGYEVKRFYGLNLDN